MKALLALKIPPASLAATLFLAALAVLSSPCFAQGPLTPPGAPAATQKTLQQIEPRYDLQAAVPPPGVTTSATAHYMISQPGSYYLSANLTVTKSTGIDITAGGVTLDLNGFVITVTGSAAASAIKIESAGTTSEVKNGKIQGNSATGSNGLVMTDSSATGGYTGAATGYFHELSINGFDRGVQVEGVCRLDQCSASKCITAGISSFTRVSCSHCDVTGSASGFSCSGGALSDCTAVSCSTGFAMNSGSCVNCSATSSSGVGFSINSSAILTNCQASANNQGGFIVSAGSVMSGCSAYFNGDSTHIANGIRFGGDGTVTNCAAYLNSGYGIFATDHTALSGCSANANGAVGQNPGIFVTSRCVVRDCNVTGNYAGGITAQDDNLISNNNVSLNYGTDAGFAGILITGSANRIEGNSLSDNESNGLKVTAIRNFIARNTARNNVPNYTVVANNRIARIVVPAANAADINGANSGSTDGFTAVDPWANFSY